MKALDSRDIVLFSLSLSLSGSLALRERSVNIQRIFSMLYEARLSRDYSRLTHVLVQWHNKRHLRRTRRILLVIEYAIVNGSNSCRQDTACLRNNNIWHIRVDELFCVVHIHSCQSDTDTQTDRQTDRQADRQTDRQANEVRSNRCPTRIDRSCTEKRLHSIIDHRAGSYGSTQRC
jgi:hypothetical protein